MLDIPSELLWVPDIRQHDNYSCGAACAMAVGRSFGVGPDSLSEWKKQLGTSVELSTPPANIVAYLSSLGLAVEERDGMSLDDLLANWKRGYKTICCIQDYGSRRNEGASFLYGHYVVVLGSALGFIFCFDPSADNVLEGSDSDAAPGRVMIDTGTWEKVWHDKDYSGKRFVRYGISVGPPSLGIGMTEFERLQKAMLVYSYDAKALHKFSSTQFNIADGGYSRTEGSPIYPLRSLSDAIADADLAADGREKEHHVTVKYGLHTSDPDEVRWVIRKWLQSRKGQPGYLGIHAKLGAVSLFPGNEYDVVKVDVDSQDLRQLNKFISDHLPHTDTHPEYKPHVTIAYVKPGLGEKYLGRTLGGHGISFHNLVFSDADGRTTNIDFREEGKYEKAMSAYQEDAGGALVPPAEEPKSLMFDPTGRKAVMRALRKRYKAMRLGKVIPLR